MDNIFIPGNVPSSKNGKRWTGKVLIHSKATMKYIKATKDIYQEVGIYCKELIKEKEAPYKVSFKFIRGSRRKFDYVNPLQTVQDLMVKYDWIEDDNMTYLLPVLEPYEYDKEKPGVYTQIL